MHSRYQTAEPSMMDKAKALIQQHKKMILLVLLLVAVYFYYQRYGMALPSMGQSAGRVKYYYF